MQSFESTTILNNIDLINRVNPNSPRTSINVFINGGNRTESRPGIADLTAKLMLKGTKNRTAEEIANETDSNAIDLDLDVKQDYTRLRSTFLNDDIDKAIEIISDILQNPTFKLFNKEVKLFKGELQVELDSPRAKATDKLIRIMYPNHPYGVVASNILENIAEITKEDIVDEYRKTFKASNINIAVVGIHSQKDLVSKFEASLQSLSTEKFHEDDVVMPDINENKLVTTSKEDASQAQIIRGWYGPPISSDDYVPLLVLNNILGAAGLSSRLFIELRDKKGLAYAVRSSLEMLRFGSNFSAYIGTEPKNIEVAIKGFDEEIEKLLNQPVTEKELDAARKNILGKRAIFHETNSQQCYYLGLYHTLKAGAEYDQKIPEMIKATKAEDIQRVAQIYLSKNHITSILAPSEFLASFEREKV